MMTTTGAVGNDNVQEDDEFWGIAMMGAAEEGHDDNADDEPYHNDDNDNDGTLSSEQLESGSEGGKRRIRYKLPNYNMTTSHATARTTTTTSDGINNSVILELQPLAQEDGVFSPTGADAWYASALLTAMMFAADDDDGHCSDYPSLSSLLTTRLYDSNNHKTEFQILELGSGAVGLPGLACAVALNSRIVTCSNRRRKPCPSPKSWSITMTDIDHDCLCQLRKNVASNLPKLKQIGSSGHDEATDYCSAINVELLDWNDGFDKQDSNIIQNLDLVIGSELVYNDVTAHALLKLIKKLLGRNPNIEIWIVQVMDRYGWLVFVLRGLLDTK